MISSWKALIWHSSFLPLRAWLEFIFPMSEARYMSIRQKTALFKKKSYLLKMPASWRILRSTVRAGIFNTDDFC